MVLQEVYNPEISLTYPNTFYCIRTHYMFTILNQFLNLFHIHWVL